VLTAIVAVAFLAAAVAIGHLWGARGSGSSGSSPSATSVDAGFARDMSTHHQQADGSMPGMATPAQMSKLESLHGKALDVYFLQLIIHHHQGGLPMAQYAAAHASQQYVRDLAQSMVTAQSGEIVQMERLLRQLGSAPLPPPTA